MRCLRDTTGTEVGWVRKRIEATTFIFTEGQANPRKQRYVIYIGLWWVKEPKVTLLGYLFSDCVGVELPYVTQDANLPQDTTPGDENRSKTRMRHVHYHSVSLRYQPPGPVRLPNNTKLLVTRGLPNMTQANAIQGPYKK